EVAGGVVGSVVFVSGRFVGRGFPVDVWAMIFDLFYNAARGDRGGQGTGLGMAICHGKIGAHGGRHAVEEGIEGQGTRITFFLP
ncbi:ATP-binding protein, partial [Pseudomonas syringae group genomosp. 7]|uniref:ATP-binding protein n=1 Tax=Pseudomonas syringae group genomosp. 7 TaxID=251699 RepID=UPI00376F8C46